MSPNAWCTLDSNVLLTNGAPAIRIISLQKLTLCCSCKRKSHRNLWLSRVTYSVWFQWAYLITSFQKPRKLYHCSSVYTIDWWKIIYNSPLSVIHCLPVLCLIKSDSIVVYAILTETGKSSLRSLNMLQSLLYTSWNCQKWKRNSLRETIPTSFKVNTVIGCDGKHSVFQTFNAFNTHCWNNSQYS